MYCPPKVGIEYNVDRKLVEALLEKVASITDGLLNEPKPKVYVAKMAESYIEYEIRAYTDQPNRLVEPYSDIQKNIIDVFNEAKIELKTPIYIQQV